MDKGEVMFIIAYALFLHFIADFVLQSREMGKQKSHNIIYLIGHVIIQWFVLFFGLLVVLDHLPAYQIASINALLHGVIDWNIWKVYKIASGAKLKGPIESFRYWEDRHFYSTIGFDQYLHVLSILVAIKIIL